MSVKEKRLLALAVAVVLLACANAVHAGVTVINFTSNSGGDGFINASGTSVVSYAAAWASAEGGAGPVVFSAETNAEAGFQSSHDSKYRVGIRRSYLPFDTSALPDNAAIISASVFVYVTTSLGGAGTTAVADTQASNTSLASGDWANIGSTSFVNRTSFTVSAYNEWALNANGVALVSKTSFTDYSLIDLDDFNNNATTGAAYKGIFFNTSDASGSNPYLSITYSTNDAPNVSLTKPPNGFTSSSKAVYFNYTPLEMGYGDGGGFSGASLIVYYGNGTLLASADNASAVTNNSINTVAYTFAVDGTYLWNVNVTDNASAPLTGNASENYTVVVSTAAAASLNVSLNSPLNDTWNTSKTINFTYTPVIQGATYANATTSIWYGNGTLLNNTNLNTTGIADNSANWLTYVFAVDGNYLWNMLIYGTGLNNQSSENYTIKIDSTTPSSIVYVTPTPLNNSWRNYNYSYVNASFTESNPDTCLLDYVYSNSSPVNLTMTLVTGASPYCWFNVSSQSDGQANFTAYVNDSAGNWGSNLSTYKFFIDTVTPTGLTWVSTTPSQNANLSQSYAYANFSFTEANPDSCLVDVNGTNQTGTISGNYCFFNATLMSDGLRYFTGYLNDTSGNWNWTENRTFVLDTVAPSTTSNATAINGTWVNYNVSVGFATVETGSGVQYTWECVGSATCSNWTVYSVPETFTTEGANYISYFSEDYAGNNESAQQNIIEIDYTMPSSVQLVSPTPANNSNLTQNYFYANVSFTEANPDNCLLERNGTNYTAVLTVGYCYYNSSDLANGDYWFKMWVNDSAGNLNVSAQQKVSLNASTATTQGGVTTTNFTADGGNYDGNLTKAALKWSLIDAVVPWVNTTALLDEAARMNGTIAAKRRGFMSVDTSSIPDDAVVTNATLWFFVYATSTTNYGTTFYSGDNCFGTLDNHDWIACATNEGNMTSFTVGAFGAFNAKSILASSVSKTSHTQFRLVQANESVEPPSGSYFYMRWASGDAPAAIVYKLEVSYETNGAPRVSLNSPSSASWNASRSVNFTFTPQEDGYATGGSYSNCSLFLWWINGTVLANQSNQSDIANNSGNYINYTFAADGRYLWNVECYDNATNPLSASASENFTLFVDATPPSDVQFVSPTPANNSNLTQNYFYANVSFTEANPNACLLERNASNYSAMLIGVIGGGAMCYLNSTGLADGEYWYKMWVNDSAGNLNVSPQQKVFLDTVAPSTTSNSTVINDSWVTYNVSVQLSCADPAPSSSCQYVWYCIGSASCSNWSVYSAPINFTEATNYLLYFSQDYAGNNESVKQNIIKIDYTAPSVDWLATSSPFANGSNASQNYVYANFSATDATSGIDSCYLWRNGTAYPATKAVSYCFLNSGGLADGQWWIKLQANDTAGNSVNSSEKVFFLDTVAPSTSSNFSANDSWATQNKTVNLTCSDAAPATGCRYLWYCTGVGCSNWTVYAGVLDFNWEGTTNLFYKSEDWAGNNETVKQNIVKIDYSNPSTTSNATAINNTWVNYDVTVSLSSIDSVSGVQYTWKCTGASACSNWTVYSTPITFTSETTNYVRYFAQDYANNNESVKDNWIKIDKTRPAALDWVSSTPSQGANLSQAYAYANFSFVEVNPDSCLIDVNGTNRTGTIAGSYCWFNASSMSDGLHYFTGYVNDTAGNLNNTANRTFKLDMTAPSTTSNATAINDSWVNYNVSVKLSCADATSGCRYVWYCQSAGCSPNLVYSLPIAVTSEGTNYFRYKSEDWAGNNESLKENWLKIDYTPPTLSFVSPVYPTGQVFNDSQNWVPVNASFTEANPDTCVLNWNGTNQSFAPTGSACWVNKTGIAAYGNYSYAVYLNDSAGNWNWSGARSAYAELCRNVTSNYSMVGNAAKSGATCFVIGAQSISFDCNNNTVVGNASAGTYGIYVNGSGNVVLRNCVATNFSTGIYFYNSSGGRVESSNSSYNSQHGIFLNSSSNATISSCVASQNTLNGLYFFNSSNNAVDGVNASGDNNSAFLNASSNNSFSNNNFVSSAYYGAWLVSSNSSNFSGDNTSYNNFSALFLQNSVDDEFANWFAVGNYSSAGYRDVNSTSASNNYLVNASFNESSTAFGDTASNVTVKWYLNVLVTDQYGTAIAGAFVNISDYNNSLLFEGSTQSNGYIAAQQKVTEYVQNSSGNASFTPHAVYASKGPVGFTGTIVNESKTVIVVLGMSYGGGYFEPKPTPPPEPSPQPSPEPTAQPGGRPEEPSPTPSPRPSPTQQPQQVTIEGKVVNASLVEKTLVGAEKNASACTAGNTSVLEITRQTKIFEVRKEGGVIDYYTQVILFVKNKGDALLRGIEVVDELPAELLPKTVFSQKPASVEGTRVTWFVDSIAGGETKQIDYVIKQRVEASAFKTPQASAQEIVAGVQLEWFYALAAALALVAAAAVYLIKRKKSKTREK